MDALNSLIKLRNNLVYTLIIVAASLAILSIASYLYNFSFLIWLLLIALFFGMLGVILNISNRIFDINNPDYVENTNQESVIAIQEDPELLNADHAVKVKESTVNSKGKNTPISALPFIVFSPLILGLMAWFIIFMGWIFLK